MQGKTWIIKNVGNKFWESDLKMKNSKGKKRSWVKAEAKMASRKIRRILSKKPLINE